MFGGDGRVIRVAVVAFVGPGRWAWAAGWGSASPRSSAC